MIWRRKKQGQVDNLDIDLSGLSEERRAELEERERRRKRDVWVLSWMTVFTAVSYLYLIGVTVWLVLDIRGVGDSPQPASAVLTEVASGGPASDVRTIDIDENGEPDFAIVELDGESTVLALPAEESGATDWWVLIISTLGAAAITGSATYLAATRSARLTT